MWILLILSPLFIMWIFYNAYMNKRQFAVLTSSSSVLPLPDSKLLSDSDFQSLSDSDSKCELKQSIVLSDNASTNNDNLLILESKLKVQ